MAKFLPGIVCVFVGAILGGSFVAYRLGAFASYQQDTPWSLPGFDYQEFGKDAIYVTGTLKGPHVGYPYNTWDIRCFREESKCVVANVNEIGKNQLGEITAFDWPILSWSDTVVVLQDDASPNDTSCARNTITINREGRSVSYTSVPINMDRDYCKMYKLSGNNQWEIGMPVQPWEKETTKQ